MTDVLGVDTDRADRMIGLIVSVIVPHLDESRAVLRAAGSAAELVDETNTALRHVDAGLQTMGWLARFVDSRTRAASAADSAPVMPPGATVEGVASYLDQYLQTGSAHLFAADEGPNATHARDLFDHAVRTGGLIERDGWFQPASCADACESPYANPASRALLGVENMVEAEAMAEGQLDMIAGTSGVATLQIMRGAFKRFKLKPPDSAPWLDGMPARQLPVDEHKVPTPDVSLPHTQLGHSRKSKGYTPQAREWDYGSNGRLQPIRDIDFTDHGKPDFHSNPHQHRYRVNNGRLAPVGGVKRGQQEPL